jgi:ubiquinone/menaquinone biosynthesis C-methylase UbiE
MTHDRADDVPSPIDLRAMEDAREWAATVMSKRPWREQFFQQFINQLRVIDSVPLRVLELGSGPGFLAQRILESIPSVEYTMLDFSQAMHDLARERLGPLMQHVRAVVADFKQDRWGEGLDNFDAVITIQAVHELRHKKHALALHRSARSLLSPRGRYLVCDHYAGGDGMVNTALFMTVAEQRNCLEAAGFGTVINVLEMHGLVLHRATPSN